MYWLFKQNKNKNSQTFIYKNLKVHIEYVFKGKKNFIYIWHESFFLLLSILLAIFFHFLPSFFFPFLSFSLNYLSHFSFSFFVKQSISSYSFLFFYNYFAIFSLHTYQFFSFQLPNFSLSSTCNFFSQFLKSLFFLHFTFFWHFFLSTASSHLSFLTKYSFLFSNWVCHSSSIFSFSPSQDLIFLAFHSFFSTFFSFELIMLSFSSYLATWSSFLSWKEAKGS